LQAVRSAMRGIDDSLARIHGGETPLALRISAPGPYFAAGILEAIAEVRSRHPRIRPELSSLDIEQIIHALCRGEVDFCVHESVLDHPDLECHPLTTLERTVACGPGHPLAGEHRASLEQIQGHPFAAPRPDARGIRPDGWPIDVHRTVGWTVGHMQMAIDACESGRSLAVLPRPVVQAAGLEAIDIDGLELPRLPLYVSKRRPLATQPAAFDDLLMALKSAFAVG